MKNEINEKILLLIQEMKDDSTISFSDPLIQGGVIDSFDIINLIPLLENGFQITIQGETITQENFEYIENIGNLVRACQRL
jgi:acyl carrier protein